MSMCVCVNMQVLTCKYIRNDMLAQIFFKKKAAVQSAVKKERNLANLGLAFHTEKATQLESCCNYKTRRT